MYERYMPIKDSPVKFQDCCAEKCVRQSFKKKEYWQYTIEETCLYGQNGNNSCIYKRHEKIERNSNARPEPATEARV